MFMRYERRYDGVGLVVGIEFSGSPLPETNIPAALLDLSFQKVRRGGGYGGAAVPLGEVPPVLLAESWADLHAMAAAGSGFDPDWEKKNSVVSEPHLRAPAEERFAAELAALAAADRDRRRPVAHLRARGSAVHPRGCKLGVTRKFYGDDPLVDRAIVSLMSNQGLMLVGEPGTAKSMLSELLAAAIPGGSGLVVQGSAGTTEDHLRYAWNYALLLAEGPSERRWCPPPCSPRCAKAGSCGSRS